MCYVHLRALNVVFITFNIVWNTCSKKDLFRKPLQSAAASFQMTLQNYSEKLCKKQEISHMQKGKETSQLTLQMK